MKEKILNLWTMYQADILPLVQKILITLLILVSGRIAVWVSKKLIRKIETSRFQIDKTLISVLKKTASYGVLIICIVMILDLFGVNTNSLIAVLGAAGVAVGLALKDTLGNIAAGIVLLVQRSYHRGDWIEFGSIQGSVREMGLFTTILETGDGVYISAPNSSIWGTPLKNYTRNGKRRMDLAVTIAYTDSIDTAFGVLRGIVEAEDRFMKDPAPQIMVQSLEDRGVNLLIRAWASTDVYWNVYWDQTRNIKEKIGEAGLTIPFPQRDIHITTP